MQLFHSKIMTVNSTLTNEAIKLFEQRKRDHIELALLSQNQAAGLSGLDQIHLPHEALPECNFDEIKLHCQRLQNTAQTPFLISSMTAGHTGAIAINRILAEAASIR